MLVEALKSVKNLSKKKKYRTFIEEIFARPSLHQVKLKISLWVKDWAPLLRDPGGILNNQLRLRPVIRSQFDGTAQILQARKHVRQEVPRLDGRKLSHVAQQHDSTKMRLLNKHFE